MKKSNKLLLGGLLAVVIFITMIHVTIYAKYKSADYTLYQPNQQEQFKDRKALPGVRKVILQDVASAELHVAKDGAISNANTGGVSYQVIGDSLVVSGKKQEFHPQGHPPVILHLPPDVFVSVKNSGVTVYGTKELAGSSTFELAASSIFFRGVAGFSRLDVKAKDRSQVNFVDSMYITSLAITLENSSLSHQRGDVGEFQLMTDSLSNLDIQSKYFLRARQGSPVVE